jgi:hypothetical protein
VPVGGSLFLFQSGFSEIIKIETKFASGVEFRYSFLYSTLTVSWVNSIAMASPIILFALCLICVAPAMVKLSRASRLSEITAEWIESFSVSTYYPMQGLLNSEDFTFLSRQPGFDFTLHKKLRRERLQIFRCYLDRMIVDFNRLHLVAKYAIANAKEDRSDLLKQLVWVKLRFTKAVLQAELNYRMCQLGYQSLGAKALIGSLDQLVVLLPSAQAQSL